MAIGSVFENNRTQAVRLPAGTRFEPGVKRVVVRVLGDSRILEPLHHSWDTFFNSEEEGVTDDFLNVRPTQEQPERESFDD